MTTITSPLGDRRQVMCIWPGVSDTRKTTDTDTDAIGERLKTEFCVAADGLSPEMQEILQRLYEAEQSKMM